jgi:hypothetical protein
MTADVVDSTGGRWAMVVVAVMIAVSTLMVFRPRRQSGFSEAGGYGPGYGSESIMFGASGRKGAAR